jgi:hypothetical protein
MKLTKDEQNIVLPMLVKALKSKNGQIIVGQRICDFFNMKQDQLGFKKSLNLQRLRALINHIRESELAPICANSDGYWNSNDPDEIIKEAESLESRCASIMNAARGMRQMAKQIQLEVTDPLGFTW